MSVNTSEKNKLLLAIGFLSATLLFSCSDNSEDVSSEYKIFEEGFINSNKAISNFTTSVYFSLENKLADPVSAVKAGIWYPKAMTSQKLSKELIGAIEKLKISVDKKKFANSKESHELEVQFKKYEKGLNELDSGMISLLNETLIFTTKSFDTLPETKQQFFQTFFDQKSKGETLAMLSKFQNNILIIESKIARYCDNKISVHGDFFDTYAAIIGQNTTYLRAGESIEITAGVGNFSITCQPRVTINGRKIPVNGMGTANVKFLAPRQPGKHQIPVEVAYIDQEGKRQSLTKTVEYYVVAK